REAHRTLELVRLDHAQADVEELAVNDDRSYEGDPVLGCQCRHGLLNARGPARAVVLHEEPTCKESGPRGRDRWHRLFDRVRPWELALALSVSRHDHRVREPHAYAGLKCGKRIRCASGGTPVARTATHNRD